MIYDYLTAAVNAQGLSQEESIILKDLINVYHTRLDTNCVRRKYYEDKTKAQNLGIAIPKKFEVMLEASLGWAAKCVDKLAERSQFDGFLMAGDENDELNKIFNENDIMLAYQMAVPSELIHGVGFWAVHKSDTEVPRIRYFSAEDGAALWDYNNRRIKAGFVITDFQEIPMHDPLLQPKHVILHTENKITEIHRIENTNEWYANSMPHQLGRPCMVAMAYRPSDLKPFGKSRITRAVMAIVDEMQRETMRTEISSEIYSAPMRYILGIEDDAFEPDEKGGYKDSKEMSYWTNLLTMNRDEDGNVPVVGQLETATMQPHIDVMRNLATRISAEADVPVSEFGVIHDNPASAEALRASMESLCVQAELLNKINGKALIEIAKYAVCIKQNKSYNDLTDEEKKIRICWRNPFTPSIASTTDAMLKQTTFLPWLSESEVCLEALGYNEAQREKMMTDKKRIQAEQAMREATQQLAMQKAQNQQENTETEVIAPVKEEQNKEKETLKDGDLIKRRSTVVPKQSGFSSKPGE